MSQMRLEIGLFRPVEIFTLPLLVEPHHILDEHCWCDPIISDGWILHRSITDTLLDNWYDRPETQVRN